MMHGSIKLKFKDGKVFESKFVGNGLSSYEKIIYRAAVSQRLSNAGLSYWPLSEPHVGVRNDVIKKN